MTVNTIQLSGNAEENRSLLQKALDRKGMIRVAGKGTYDVAGTLLISGDTTLEFEPGVILNRVDGKGLHFIANRAAYDASAEPDRNIEIRNLHFNVNGSDGPVPYAPGWRGPVMLMHVRDLKIFNFRCVDLAARGYGVLISSFERVLIDGVHIEGEKDGVHFGPGKDFILRKFWLTAQGKLGVGSRTADFDIGRHSTGHIFHVDVQQGTYRPAAVKIDGTFCKLEVLT